MEEQLPWHRLFGLYWSDFFEGLPVVVEMEKDLSVKKQLLDVLLIRLEAALLDIPLPNGFDDLAAYNLISFKSHQQKLSSFALKELIGHYVNLRKQVSPSMDESDLLPENQFRLFAVSVRFPQQLAASGITLEEVQSGVYNIPYLDGSIRLIVVNQLPIEEKNAMLHLFSTRGELLKHGMQHYRQRSSATSTVFYKLIARLSEEGETMSDALAEFARKTIDEILKDLPIEKRLEGLSPEQRVEGLSPEQRVEGLSPEERVEGLSPEQLLKGLNPTDRERLRKLLDAKEESNPTP